MRTNIVLDDALVQAAMKSSGARTKREVVHLALRRLVEERSAAAQRVLELATESCLDPDYDVRAVRRSMSHGSG